MAALQRWIIHADLDAFYASVEELLDPELRGKPLIVGGDPRYRGVVSSASYAARAYGVRSAMPVAQAMRLCPRLIIVPGHYDRYEMYSHQVMDILRDYTPDVEQISIDEAFLDVTGCERLWGTAREIAQMIQRRVLEEAELPISLGVASNKLVAKIASDVGKPRGLVVVEPGQEQAFLAPLPIERLWGVGQVTGARLREYGVRTIGDLADWSEEELVRLFGEGGHGLYRGARGLDEGEVVRSHTRHSISQERTFARDVDDEATLLRALLAMSEHVAGELRRRHMAAQTVRVKLRRPDFTTFSRQTTLTQPTDQQQVVYDTACQLFRKAWAGRRPLRLVGVGVSGLLREGGYQLDLFDATDQKRIQLNRSLDEIRARYGRRAIRRASLLRGEQAERRHELDKRPSEDDSSD
jgi:DNA polymerase-4